MGREFELKFRADAETIALIREKYGIFTSISMETTYYDTFDLKLAMHRWTLRRRMENGVSVCTFKRPHKDGGRGEWEVECPNIMEGILALCKAGADEELLRVTAGGLMEVCGARFTRLAGIIELPGAQAELALDRGVLTGGGREVPLCEVEVEHKSGAEEETVAFARELAARFGLEPERRLSCSPSMPSARGFLV